MTLQLFATALFRDHAIAELLPLELRVGRLLGEEVSCLNVECIVNLIKDSPGSSSVPEVSSGTA